MKYQQWKFAAEAPEQRDALRSAGYSYLVSSVLSSRGIRDAREAQQYLSCGEELLHEPFLLKDMDRAVERIRTAMQNGECLAVYGDYDVDGITATCLLTDYLKSRGADCLRYIPRRIEDGYGLNKDAIEQLRRQGVTLLITVDCGITGLDETDYAKTLGMDIVITDHHECKEQLPAAVAVVDPHRPDCTYPFKQLAGVGVALKLVLALAGTEERAALMERYCTLAAIGTVADVMQMRDENRTIVTMGLQNMAQCRFVGIRALLKESGMEGRLVSSVQVGFTLAPRVNAAGRMGRADIAADLLLTDDPAQAELLARELCELNRERQNVEQEIFAEAEKLLLEIPEEQRYALVLSSERWHQGVVGIVASRLSEKYACPSFMIHLTGEMGKGSCRSFGGFNLFAALEQCADLLEGFGGHELAAGFTIRRENIPAFRQRINRCVREFSGGMSQTSSLDVDVVLTQPHHITMEEVEQLNQLEPYGAGNARPIFCLCGATVDSLQNIGQNKHLKLCLSKGSMQLEGVFFAVTAENCGVAQGQRVDAAFYLQVNEFHGNRSLQLHLVDLRPSLYPSAREEECRLLVENCLNGKPISPKEARRLLPTREQFARLWRTLESWKNQQHLVGAQLPLLRELAVRIEGNEPFLRTMLALQVLEERGLLQLNHREGLLEITLSPGTEKTDLEECPYMKLLHCAEAADGRGEET